MTRMIRRQELSRACRHNDTFAETGKPLERALPDLGFNSDDTRHVALQRALRAYAILKGTDVAKMRTSDIQKMSQQDRMMITMMSAIFIDGLAASARAIQEQAA